jgi:hypothetical protein
MRTDSSEPRSRALIFTLLAGLALMLPFVLLAIGLIEERLVGPRGPIARLYDTIGIWEPLEELHDGVADLFGA